MSLGAKYGSIVGQMERTFFQEPAPDRSGPGLLLELIVDSAWRCASVLKISIDGFFLYLPSGYWASGTGRRVLTPAVAAGQI